MARLPINTTAKRHQLRLTLTHILLNFMTIGQSLVYRSILMILWLFCRSMMAEGFDRDGVRSGFGRSIDPCYLNMRMVKLNHIQSAPSHHEYDRIDCSRTRENPRTNATER
jgi:hypothetical protein